MSSIRQDGPHRFGGSGGSVFSAPPPPTAASPRRQGTLSIIIPAKNEAKSLPQLAAEVARAFRPLVARRAVDAPHPLLGYELLVVDDGSTDDTARVLEDLAGPHPELRPLRLAENAGQSAAITVGFHAARGDWVAILDADLQNDPADLASLWDALPGHDAALGWRTTRQDVWSKRVISRWANRVRNAVLKQDIRDTGCAVRIFPRDVALRMPMFHGAHRFFGAFLYREGCKIVQQPVSHRPRPHGTSHYNLRNRSLKVIIDLIGVAWLMRRPVRARTMPIAEPHGCGLPASLASRASAAPSSREA